MAVRVIKKHPACAHLINHPTTAAVDSGGVVCAVTRLLAILFESCFYQLAVDFALTALPRNAFDGHL